MLNKYTYNRILLCLLGKNWVQVFKKRTFFSGNNDIMTEYNYDE